jgi:hypothetical protein
VPTLTVAVCVHVDRNGRGNGDLRRSGGDVVQLHIAEKHQSRILILRQIGLEAHQGDAPTPGNLVHRAQSQRLDLCHIDNIAFGVEYKLIRVWLRLSFELNMPIAGFATPDTFTKLLGCIPGRLYYLGAKGIFILG